ncbi:aromatic acid exporter family protein [Staphylococcus aureus]|nr:aromatic acid exporter family protein [Staphylococcus aureus]MCQ6800260.1 aromatic acid exporter family protein [Staphylococcus aureus]MCQ6805783.1 aromatic acid exporter family protein [Staphylococcus aureus]QCX45114.1 Integral membrane protein [Staphylococcus aureus]
MNDQWYKHLIGARTIKTGIAIFLTAVFCMALDLGSSSFMVGR